MTTDRSTPSQPPSATHQLPRRHTTLSTGMGELLAVAQAEALVGLYFPEHWHPPTPDTIGTQVSATGDPVFEATRRELAEYFRGQRTTFTVPTAACGDAFSERVWDLLALIPYGTTTTYGAIARDLGNRAWPSASARPSGTTP